MTNSTKESIAEKFYLSIGGIDQWIWINCKDKKNPILIFLHGGPGISLHGAFRHFHRDIENHFILIGYDQRGAGKSYSDLIPQESMSINIFVSDLHELVQYLKEKFNHDKVYVLGESWGSLLGITYVLKYPEDVIAFIGTGQITNLQESEQLGYEFMIAQAEKQNNQEAIIQLHNIKQPPFSSFDDIGILRAWLMKFGGCLYKQTSYEPFLNKLADDKDSLPDFSGANFSLRSLHKELFHTNLFTQIPELKVPIYFLEGRHDYQVSSKLAAQYLNNLKAPIKEFVWFEYSGHNPMFEEPVKFKDELLNIAYPFTFKPVQADDLPLLHTWFKMPHVDLWWPVPTEQEDFFKSFLERIRAGIKKPYIVLLNDLPIGYIQSYSVDQTTHSWLPQLPSSGNVIGIDQFIGKPDYLYKGFGPLFIKKFIDDLIAKDKNLTIIVDPDPANTAAIRCYEKAGFTKVGVHQAPWGPALIMIYNEI